jgi:glyoxylase-like metal-dependent hydrolase (beta-lactamase superfamily II)
LGDLDVFSLSDGAIEGALRSGMVRNATIEDVRAALKEADQSDQAVRTPFTAMAIVKAGNLMLVDTGTGGFSVYGPHCGYLTESLAAAGLDPQSVRTILLTHLHGDHIYGLFRDEALAPRYPNAQIVLPAAELRWWTQPGVEAMDLGPTRAGLALCIQTTLAVWPNVRAFDDKSEVLPGVYPVPAYGHSPGHTAYVVSTGNSDLLITADVCVNPALYLKRPDWQAALDQDPALAVATRRRIFDRAASERLLVTGTHWGLPNIGTIRRDGSGYAFEPLAESATA